MAIKLQSSHLSHFLNLFSSKRRRTHPAPPKPSSAKAIGLDGRVRVFHHRVKAEELMKEEKNHFVCKSDSFIIGQKLSALADDDELQLGESYFILPSLFFQSALSYVTISSAIAKIRGQKNGGNSLRHFDIHLVGNGKLQIKICEEIEEKRENGILCTTKEIVKEYEKIVGSELQKWRPKLETICELRERRKKRMG